MIYYCTRAKSGRILANKSRKVQHIWLMDWNYWPQYLDILGWFYAQHDQSCQVVPENFEPYPLVGKGHPQTWRRSRKFRWLFIFGRNPSQVDIPNYWYCMFRSRFRWLMSLFVWFSQNLLVDSSISFNFGSWASRTIPLFGVSNGFSPIPICSNPIKDPQLHRRFCRSCGVSEYVMDLGNGTRICSLADGKEGCRPKILGEHWLRLGLFSHAVWEPQAPMVVGPEHVLRCLARFTMRRQHCNLCFWLLHVELSMSRVRCWHFRGKWEPELHWSRFGFVHFFWWEGSFEKPPEFSSANFSSQKKMIEGGFWGVRVQGSGGRLLCFCSML